MNVSNASANPAFAQQSAQVNNAVRKIFKSMFAMEIEARNSPVSNDLASDGVVVAVISLVGDLEWSVWLGMPRPVATGATSEFIGEEVPFEEVEEIADAVGEMANMIAGEVKANLSNLGFKTHVSLPNVICGESLAILPKNGHPSVRTRFGSKWGDFWIEVVAGVTEGETRAVGS